MHDFAITTKSVAQTDEFGLFVLTEREEESNDVISSSFIERKCFRITDASGKPNAQVTQALIEYVTGIAYNKFGRHNLKVSLTK